MGDHHLVAAVRQQLHLGEQGVGAVEHAHRRFLTAGGADVGDLAGGVRIERRGLGNALLEQQGGRLEQRRRFEALLHRAIQQHRGQRQETHALVMGHEGPHHGARLPAGQPGRRVVDGLEEAEGSGQPGGGEAL